MFYNVNNLQKFTHTFSTTAEKYNMEILTNKTKAMMISKKPIPSKWEINKKIIQQIMKFTYSSIEILNELSNYRGVWQQVKAERVFGILEDVT